MIYKYCLTRRRLFDFTVLNYYWTVLLTRSNKLLFVQPSVPHFLSPDWTAHWGSRECFFQVNTRRMWHMCAWQAAVTAHSISVFTPHTYTSCAGLNARLREVTQTHSVYFFLLKEFIGYLRTFLLCDWLLGGYTSVFNVFALLAPPTHHHYPPSFLATPSFPLVQCPGTR